MIEKTTYYLLNVKQGSSDWHYLRKGRITASNLAKIMNCAPYCKDTPEEIGKHLVGIKKEEHTEEAQKRMQLGNDYEPIIREYLSKYLKCEIEETGFAIWKENKIFGASLDGVIDDDTCIEIKCPRKMYKPLINYMKNDNKDEENYNHIWKSHYLQMQMNMIVTNRRNCIYAVYSIDDDDIFIQNVKVNKDYWYNVVYPACVDFYAKYMEPLLSAETKDKIELKK